MREYIDKIDAVTIPVLPKEQRADYCNKDDAFEAGWKTCQEYIATCIESEDVISRKAAIHEVESIYSPYGEAGTGDAISREVVLSRLGKLGKTADPDYPPFGSFGDSVTLDEFLKQTETVPEMQNGAVETTTNPTYGDNCWARLPCGICRLTMMNCPLSVMQPTWTCSSNTATTQTGKGSP